MSNRAFDVIALAVGLGVLLALGRAAAGPPPVPEIRRRSAAEIFTNEMVTGTI